MSEGNGRQNITINAGASTKPRVPTVDPTAARVAEHCGRLGLRQPVIDYSVCGRLLADCCWPDLDLCLIALSGRLKRDLQRINACATDGWFVLVVTAEQLADGSAFDLVAKAVAAVS